MSFRYKSQTITLENYRTIFKVCSPDILDEIRSAVLDDTSISSFIKPCGTDSYKLGQLRMAVRELVPIEYLSTYVTGKTIYNIRQGFLKGRDMSPILSYYTSKGVTIDADTLEKLSEFCFLGIDISKMDFTTVPTNLVDVVCKGLYHGYPMWLIVEDGCTLTEGDIQVLMRGLSLGIDVHPFLNGDWSKEAMLLMFSYAKSVDINEVLSLVNSKFDCECIKVLLDLAQKNVPINKLCVKDTSGTPVYNSFQMYELGKAIEEGVDTPKMFDATLSDFDINELREREIAKKNRKLSANLNKKPKLEKLF